MELQLTPEQQEQLSQIAGQTGRSTGDLAREAVEQYIAEEASVRAGVQAGLDDVARGNVLTSAEVWVAIERELED